MLQSQNALAVAKQWIEDWNNHDLEAIIHHYAETVEFTSPLIIKLTDAADGTLRSKRALRDYFAKGLAAYPDLRFELIQVLTSVNSLVIYYRSVQNQIAAEFMVLNSDGLVERAVAHYGLSL